MSYVEPLMRRNFLEYASYVIVDRAIPDLRDGCKPVQRRLLWTLFEMDDGRFHKVANVIGETMKLHPHGDASIGDALVVLANKEYFIERQGNFGSILTGHPAAAARYIECRLTDLARDTLFHPKLTELRASYDGRKDEPVMLPAKLPVVLMLGTEGIAVGMATRILPHNLGELLSAQIAVLRGEDVALVPDFPQGGLMDAAEYDDGRGRVRVRAKIEAAKDRKTLTIREIPFGTTTESLIASIEQAVQKSKLKVGTIEDRTAESVEIVLHLPRGVYADEVEPRLYAYTQCEMSISSNLTVIDVDRPIEPTVSDLLRTLTDRLREQIRAELELELSELEDRRHWLTLEQIFIENRVYQALETAKTGDEVRKRVWDGMRPYEEFFLRAMTEDDVDRLLKIPIRRISLFDIERFRRDIEEIAAEIKIRRRRLADLTGTTIAYLEGLLETYGDRWPRRTRPESFDVVSKQEVARSNLKLAYDREGGFFGAEVRGDEFQLAASEYDKFVVVSKEGWYRVVGPDDKLFVGPNVLQIVPYDADEGVVLTYVYRDSEKNPWGKQIHVTGFIRDKDYDLVKERRGRLEKLWIGPADKVAEMTFVPKKRQRVHSAAFDLRELTVCGLGARGTRLAPKPVARFRFRKPDDA
ncbi:MAG: DNA topoisomerase IV subunit A [Acidobacteriota bacterium]